MTNTNYKKTIAVFDVDNTLIDSQAKLRADFIGAMQRLGVGLKPEEIGMPWYEVATKYGFSKEIFDESFNKRKTWEQSLGDGEAPLFSDTLPCLEELALNGVRMAVLSKSIAKYTDIKLKHFGLDKYFEQVVNVHPKVNTKKYGALYLISELNPTEAGPIAFIGDKPEDVLVAKDAEREYQKVCNGFYVNRMKNSLPKELVGAGCLNLNSLRELPAFLVPKDIS
ncbi:MAG: HAD hydrolase-like protein [Nanoarchaeota archaeon]